LLFEWFGVYTLFAYSSFRRWASFQERSYWKGNFFRFCLSIFVCSITKQYSTAKRKNRNRNSSYSRL